MQTAELWSFFRHPVVEMTGWAFAAHVLAALLVTADCLRYRREPTSSLFWILAAWTLPLAGALVFLVFGVDRVPHKGFRRRRAAVAFRERHAREQETLPLAYWRAVHERPVPEPPSGAAQALDRALRALSSEYPLLGGNRITPLVTGDEAYPAMLAAIERAEHHVHLQSFIIGNDAVGREFLDTLARRAADGVRVRLLYDRFGSTHAVLGRLFARYRKQVNLQVAGWTQANLLRRQFQLNLRNHRKVLVVDGRLAFTGGMNVHAASRSGAGRPPIRDYHFRVEGPIVQELQYVFMHDWHYMTGEDPGELLAQAYFPHVDAAGGGLVRVVNGGPSGDGDALRDALFLALTAAHREILIVTPYFVPTWAIVQALRVAALRGVDVRLVVPRENNHAYAGLAGRALYEDLLRAGVRIFERAPPFMHAKALLIDGQVALIGSANMDVRSMRLNYETNLLAYDEGLVDRLKSVIATDLAMSEELTLEQWERRPRILRLVENFFFLMTPVL